VLGAVAVSLVVPFVIADRLLPSDDPVRAKGLVSDVVSLIWLGFALVFTVAANEATRPMLTREADRLTAENWVGLARVTYLLAGVNATIPPPVAAPEPAASGSASAAALGMDGGPAADTDAGAGTADADASAGTGAGTATDAGAATDAGTLGSNAKGDKSPAELFKQLAPSVVTIFVKSAQEGPGLQGGGTGFLIDEEGTIATNHHVIAAMTQIRIKFQSGAVFDTVDLLVDEPSMDLALLRVDLAHPADAGPKVEAAPLTLGDSDAVVVGERAISIGNPLGLEHTLTDGLISSRRIYEGKQWIQMSVPVSPGNSGGPLFNMRGEVVGVTTAQIGGGFARAQNLNLAVPVNALKKLIRSEYPQRRKFGESSSSQW
jgi:S1-C subfamily serine protease